MTVPSGYLLRLSSMNLARRFATSGRVNVRALCYQGVGTRALSVSTVTTLGAVIISTTAFYRQDPLSCEAGHQAYVEQVGQARNQTSSELGYKDTPTVSRDVLQVMKRALRVVLRLFELGFVLAPVALLYPVYWIAQEEDLSLKSKNANEMLLWAKEGQHECTDDWKADWRRWYFEVCLKCAERSGAMVVKMMQWAGSRPDFFGNDFCSVFSRLQDNTTPHPWNHTVTMMEAAYGRNWEERIELGEILGSGCIGQVYSGMVKPKGSKERRKVAVKVLHPAVEDAIDADLDILRILARVRMSVEGPSWLHWGNMVEEFARLLKQQLDLRIEGQNLAIFAENFKNDEYVEFPLEDPDFPAQKTVLIESFLDGVPVLQYARENRDNPNKLRELCGIGIRAICQMIFTDNLLHGDLHPGNVFVSRDGSKFYVFDAGIATDYSEEDHTALVNVLGSFIRRRGRQAGEFMVDQSHNQGVVDVEGFVQKMEDLCDRATTSRKNLFMQKLGTYISFICKAAADHHVHLIPPFVSTALAVKVQEGVALSLDPTVSIIKVAVPIIVESEAKRRFQKFRQGS